ncbi:MAG TPA: aminotransferase class I/II-fold pyridoxal phosphate-dependent enzyme [Candidatus Limnocylindria bacterium]|jgi:aspartate aminotransferase
MTAIESRATQRARLRQSVEPFLSFFNGPFEQLNLQPDVANFAVGNPQEMPLPDYVAALRAHIEPRDKDWFAYKLSEPASQRTVAATLTRRTGMEWDPADVAMTNGGFAALATAIRTLVDPGDEVIFLSPPWFFYEMLILAAGGEPVRVTLEPPAFDLAVEGIEAALGPRTRAVIVNSPHNPSGRVYPTADLRRLAEVLEEASARIGHPIWIVSDEPYNRILFDGREYTSASQLYPHTIVTYSYGKTLLAPGQRIGFVTVPPTLPERVELRDELFIQQFAGGYLFPNALLQHSLEELEKLSIDIGALERRRDRLVPALRDIGYEATMPEGTFYVMARSPIEDDVAFADILARHRVLVLPGTIVETPGWFRISLTASERMVEDGIPRFAAAMQEVASGR